MNVIYKSKAFKPENVSGTYAKLNSNGEVLMVDVNKHHKTIREWWQHVSDMSDGDVSKLQSGKMVLFSGLKMDERKAA